AGGTHELSVRLRHERSKREFVILYALAARAERSSRHKALCRRVTIVDQDASQPVIPVGDEPVLLGYASRRPRWRMPWRRIARAAIMTACVALACVGVYKSFRFHYTKEYCAVCLTHASARYATIFGIPIEYRRHCVHGQVFRLCNDRDASTCAH